MKKKTESKSVTKTKFDTKQYEKNGLTEDEVLEVKEAFDLFDSDKSGEIDTEELKKALSQLGIDAKNQTLQNMIADIDKNGNASIDFDEFIEMMSAKMSDKDTREDLEKVFNLFLGDNGTDKIEIEHLKRVCKEVNEDLSDEELNEMITRADTDRDGKVSFDEFYAIMTKGSPIYKSEEPKEILIQKEKILERKQEPVLRAVPKRKKRVEEPEEKINLEEIEITKIQRKRPAKEPEEEKKPKEIKILKKNIQSFEEPEEEEKPEEIKVKQGAEFEILIGGNKTTPVHWFFVPPCPKGITPLNIKEDGSAGYKQRDNPYGKMGVGGTFIFKFRADKKGEYLLNFELSRFHQNRFDLMTKKIIVS